jgi:two-component system phosphate regulon sensor histidine kinase PhoR
LKSVRNLYLVLTSVVAGSLLSGGLAEVLDSGIGVGWCFGGHTQDGLFVLVCHVIAAVGVVLLAWCWLKLGRGITSIAKLFEDGTGGDVECEAERHKAFICVRGSGIDRLRHVVSERLENYRQRPAELEEQVGDLQVQLQLSQKQKRNTEAIIYSIRDAVVVVDECDRLLMANDAAGSLFNFDFASSLHEPIREVIDQSKAEFVDFLTRCRKNRGRATRQEIEFAEADRVKTFDCIVSCVYDDKEQVCGVVAVLHDVTREKEISQMKNDFVSHVSHELKTPLASIAAYSEMLSDGEAQDEDTRKEFCSVIQTQADRLNRLIEDILNTARIESGLVKIEKEPLSLTILIEEQLQMIKSYAEEKSITIIGEKPIVHDQVYVDKDMISQVIVNLLSNAIKYTPAGGSVRVRTEVDELAKAARASVTDTGVGIPEDELEHVFDKFYRVSANKGQAKGTGLGLNLVKQIVERVHEGRLFVSSKVGEGSTFGFELPLATAQVVGAL